MTKNGARKITKRGARKVRRIGELQVIISSAC